MQISEEEIRRRFLPKLAWATEFRTKLLTELYYLEMRPELAALIPPRVPPRSRDDLIVRFSLPSPEQPSRPTSIVGSYDFKTVGVSGEDGLFLSGIFGVNQLSSVKLFYTSGIPTFILDVRTGQVDIFDVKGLPIIEHAEAEVFTEDEKIQAARELTGFCLTEDFLRENRLEIELLGLTDENRSVCTSVFQCLKWFSSQVCGVTFADLIRRGDFVGAETFMKQCKVDCIYDGRLVFVLESYKPSSLLFEAIKRIVEAVNDKVRERNLRRFVWSVTLLDDWAFIRAFPMEKEACLTLQSLQAVRS